MVDAAESDAKKRETEMKRASPPGALSFLCQWKIIPFSLEP
jgi:hypothetical protein